MSSNISLIKAYIARDYNGSLNMFLRYEPTRKSFEGVWRKWCKAPEPIRMDSSLFPNVKWEDDKPYLIKFSPLLLMDFENNERIYISPHKKMSFEMEEVQIKKLLKSITELIADDTLSFTVDQDAEIPPYIKVMSLHGAVSEDGVRNNQYTSYILKFGVVGLKDKKKMDYLLGILYKVLKELI